MANPTASRCTVTQLVKQLLRTSGPAAAAAAVWRRLCLPLLRSLPPLSPALLQSCWGPPASPSPQIAAAQVTPNPSIGCQPVQPRTQQAKYCHVSFYFFVVPNLQAKVGTATGQHAAPEN
jgi:hypothetical protein